MCSQRLYCILCTQAQNLMEALYDEQTWKEDRYSFFQLDKQYLKEVTVFSVTEIFKPYLRKMQRSVRRWQRR